MKIRTILDQIDLGSMALPEFQRGYVWDRDQVRGLMHSLYRKHPVGSLLVWETRTENARARGDGPIAPGVVKLLLDGQNWAPRLVVVAGFTAVFMLQLADVGRDQHRHSPSRVGLPQLLADTRVAGDKKPGDDHETERAAGPRQRRLTPTAS